LRNQPKTLNFMNRKSFLRSALGTAFALTGMDTFAQNKNSAGGLQAAPAPFTLPPLPFANNTLEPYIDAMTMEIHHDRHHKAYVDNLNKAVEGKPLAKLPLEEILKDAGKHPAAIRNNGGGHYNHSFFWKILGATKGEARPNGPVAEAMDKQFGSDQNFKEEFAKAAMARFGSGWAWLGVKDKKLFISSTPNQDNPLMDVAEVKGKPVLALDVWEHAYYLKYQNKRADYIAAFWNVVDWDQVNKNYEAAIG
jgi:Fe-Mn family superoxide dismutase